MSRPEVVLFLCPHNAAKSLLAVADFDRLAARHGLPLRGDSAGTEPAEKPSPAGVETLQAEGIDLTGYQPRAVTDSDLAKAYRVISLGCAPSDLPTSSARVEQWDDVPQVSQGLVAAREAIQRHLDVLVDQLAAERHSGSRPAR